jgi:hypothetical protein
MRWPHIDRMSHLLLLFLLILYLYRIVIICKVYKLHLVRWISPFYWGWLHILLNHWIWLQLWLRLVSHWNVDWLRFLSVCLLLRLLSEVLAMDHLSSLVLLKEVRVISSDLDVLSLRHYILLALFTCRLYFLFHILIWIWFWKGWFLRALGVLQICLRVSHVGFIWKIFVATV